MEAIGSATEGASMRHF